MKKHISIALAVIYVFFSIIPSANAFWVWTPKEKTMVNPKYAAKDTPREQYEWAMRFYKDNDFKRSSEEFKRLVAKYKDSELAPEAQYYMGRSYEELGKYYYAYQAYQKVVDDYPYTKRMDEIVEREYTIAGIFQTKEEPNLMGLELSMSLERASEIYKKIVDNAPFGVYADKSLYRLGEVYRRMDRFKEAEETYEKLINDYPDSELITDAKYQLAYTKYEASLSPEYDQESTEEAYSDFEKIAKESGNVEQKEEADKIIDDLKEKKAASELKIANFYERRKKYRGALMYYKEIVTKFDGTVAAEGAKQRIPALEKRVNKK